MADVVMPGVGGLEVLERSRVLNPGAAVILMTGHATVEMAIEALRKGACDYLQKPFVLHDLGLLRAAPPAAPYRVPGRPRGRPAAGLRSRARICSWAGATPCAACASRSPGAPPLPATC